MMLRRAALASFAILLSSCLADLEGGAARLQLRNTWSDTVAAVSIGDWRRDFDPRVAPGASSETIELPVAGELDVGVWAVHGGRDTLLCVRRVQAELGGFARIE